MRILEIGVIEYKASVGLNLSKVKKALGDLFLAASTPRRKSRCTYFDTFDWRLHAGGAALEVTLRNKKFNATWIDLSGGERIGPVVLDRRPNLVEDISSLPLRRRLSPIVEMRALLPQFETLREIETLVLLNRDRKTVARIQLIMEKVSDASDRKWLDSIRYLKVLPLLGYGKCGERAIRALREAFELDQLKSDLVDRPLARLGRKPVDPSLLWVDLSPDLRTDRALKRVLLHLLNTIEINEKGAKTNIDSEFLHDFRVAIRRTRSAFTQVKGVFPSEILQRFKPELKWLGGITGPTRDLDVYLLIFDEYQKSLPDFQRKHLEPLRHFLQAHQKMEQQKMATFLGSLRYRKLKRDWRGFLESTNPETTTLPNALSPVLDVVSARIWRVYKSTVKEGKAIGPETPAEALHDLRKTCKKLRYLMEIFQALYPRTELKQLTKALKALQQNLGDFQDLDVQACTLRKFGQQMMDEDHVRVDTVFAMGTLVAGLNRRQLEAREAFSLCFDDFIRADNRALFKEVFVVQPKQPART